MMMAWIADALTASRVLLALLLAVAVASGSFPTATVILAVAWLTDLMDGRIARAAAADTRLGDWDFRIDVSLGAAILIGLMFSGLASAWLVVVPIAVLAGLTLLTGNPAPLMLLLAFAYAWFLWLLLDLRPRLWWLPFASIVLLLVVDWRRFIGVILPAFFRGVATLGRADSPDGGPVLDRWA
jgi:hypothetical protein